MPYLSNGISLVRPYKSFASPFNPARCVGNTTKPPDRSAQKKRSLKFASFNLVYRYICAILRLTEKSAGLHLDETNCFIRAHFIRSIFLHFSWAIPRT